MILASRFLRLTTPYMEGPDVIAVQRRLIALGFLNGAFDGKYGPSTAQAVIAFQQSSNIRADGIVGPVTWTALGIGNVAWGAGPYRIGVDTVNNILALYHNGVLVNTYPVATGKPATPTPVGDWVIVEKTLSPGGPFGDSWMRLSIPNGGYGIHGNDEPISIGQSVSHGCIRMHNADALAVYRVVPLGTLVTITGQVITTRMLYEGVSPGADIAAVQRMLQVLGYYKGAIDGAYGPQTAAAVRALQTAQKLHVDGIVGPVTVIAIQSAYDIALGDVQP